MKKSYGTHLPKEYSIYVDKLSVKKIVKDILVDQVEIAEVMDLKQPLEEIPSNCLLKTAYASKWNLIIADTPNPSKIIGVIRKYNRKYRP